MTTVREPRTANRIPQGERRAQIIRSATDLFATQGFDQTTMDDIAEAAKITKRTLYRYVTTKEQLLYDIHDHFTSKEFVSHIPLESDDPADRLREFVRLHVDVVARNRTEIAVFFDERRHLSPARRRAVEQRRDEYEHIATAVIEYGQERGAFFDANARLIAQAILGCLTEIYRWYDPAGPIQPQDLADQMSELFIKGAVAPEIPWSSIDASLGDVTSTITSRPATSGAADMVRETAVKAFASSGYHATSIRELAEIANVTKGAVMYHAGYKGSLLEEIHRTTFEEGIDALEKAIGPEGTAPEKLARMMVEHMVFLSSHRDEIAVINENIRYLSRVARRRIEKLRDQWVSQFRDVIDEGIDQQEIELTDSSLLTRGMIGMMNAAYRWYDPRGRVKPAELGRLYARILLFGLSPDR